MMRSLFRFFERLGPVLVALCLFPFMASFFVIGFIVMNFYFGFNAGLNYAKEFEPFK